MKNIIFLFLHIFFISCNYNSHYYGFDTFDTSLVETSDTIIHNPIEIIVPKPLSEIKASEWIEDFYYIPLETNNESLFGYCNKIIIHEDKIFLFDRALTECVFVFDMQGNYLYRLGDKGGAPHEFALLKGIAINKNNNQVALYDNKKRKMVYFSLDGKYIKNAPVHLRLDGHFAILSNNNIIANTGKSNFNKHLGILDDYRIIITNPEGSIKKGIYKYDDNENLSIAYSQIINCEDDILYYQQFINSIYSIKDGIIKNKYLINYKNFTPISSKKIIEFNSLRDFENYENPTTWLDPPIAETSSYLLWDTNDKKDEFISIYHKNTGNIISYKRIYIDTDFYVNRSPIYSHKNYFIGIADPEKLIALHSYLQKINYPIKEENEKIFQNLREDDNPVLVFFKFKEQ